LTAIAEGESEARDSLQWALQRAAKASNKVTDAVEQINPQLSIHAPKIARNIEHAPVTRYMAIWGAQEADALYFYTDKEQGTAAFREVAKQAQQTLTEIEAATESLRKFLSKQFEFKENF
jgi:chemotaxis regulatin CheY-phosphate phosphatase CheZ